MILVILILIFSNILVFNYNVNATLLLLILSLSIGLYRGITSKKFEDIFNLYPFIFKLKSKENILELIGAFIIVIIVYRENFVSCKFSIIDIISFILFTLFIYRFLFYNLTRTSTLNDK